MKPTTEGNVSNYDIAQATGLWATDVAAIASRVGASEYAIAIPCEEQGRKFERSVECYPLCDALKIADYVKANPVVKAGGLHAQAARATEQRLGDDFDRALKLMALRMN